MSKENSGNRKVRTRGGRPKGSRNRKTIVKEIANYQHTVRENGKRVLRSTFELVLQRLREKTLKDGNSRAWDELHRLIKIFEPQNTLEGVGVLVAPAQITQEEWIARAEEDNKHCKPPAGYRENLNHEPDE